MSEPKDIYFKDYFSLKDDGNFIFNDRGKASKSKVITDKFLSNYRVPINTTVMADALVSRFNSSGQNVLPELSLLFIKTYIKQLLGRNYLDQKRLISLFNKNQELVEIPYPILLLLGGLYYFQKENNKIGDLSPNKLFERINGVNNNENDFPFGIKYTGDVYSNPELYKIPSLKRKVSTRDKTVESDLTHYIPSVRLLNSSLYKGETITFDGKTINTKTIIPPIGYGIQNNFLNQYNKVFFGDYLNGSDISPGNEKLHVLTGGYLGILKPIKTHELPTEFTAFYRNLFVGSYNYTTDSLVKELNDITEELVKIESSDRKSLTEDEEKKLKTILIKSFIVFSKLKANYLSNAYGDDQKTFKDVIRKLCSVKNINKKYDTFDRSDFYFLVRSVFHRTYNQLNGGDTNYEIKHVLNNFTFTNGVYKGGNYEKVIGTNLYNIINLNDKDLKTTETQVNNLTVFLETIWGLEKKHLKKEYRLNGKSSFAIYPSAGGYLNLKTFKKENISSIDFPVAESKITRDVKPYITQENKIVEEFYDNAYGKLFIKKTFEKNKQKEFFDDFIYKNYVNDDKYQLLSTNLKKISEIKTKLKDGGKNKILKNRNKKLYLTNNFLINWDETETNIFFNNHSILNNTTRFLWFDNDLDGDLTKPDNITFNEYKNGLKDSFNRSEPELGYLQNINLRLYDHDTNVNYDNVDYNSFFDFSRIMDSVNIEKLEEFKDEFIKFSTIQTTNSGRFNLNSLIKSSSIFNNTNLSGIENENDNFKLSGDEISLLLIGNSMYNYDFCWAVGLSKYLNASLTETQEKRCDKVVDEFCSQNITIANKSVLDSVTKIGDFQLSIHNFVSSPEVLFTNVNKYDELKSKFPNANEINFRKFITRRILFGNQYIPCYTEMFITDEDEENVIKLNKRYLQSYSYYKKGDNITKSDIDRFNAYIVRAFFKYINIRFTEGNYLQLIKLIRSVSYNIWNSIDILRLNATPDKGVLDLNEWNNQVGKEVVIKYPTGFPNFTETIMREKLNDFFEKFNEITFNSIISSSKKLLNQINLLSNNVIESGLINTEKSDKNDIINELKKSTYYNIKSLYDKVSTSGNEKSYDVASSNVFLSVDDIKTITPESINESVNLFYNYKINPGFCYEDDKTLETKSYDLYEIFQVVDRGNNDIGTKVLADLYFLYKNLYVDFSENVNDITGLTNITNSTLQKILSGLATGSGFLFQQIPNYLNLNGFLSAKKNDEDISEMVNDMFGTHLNTSLFGENETSFNGLTGFPGYIFQLGVTNSEVNSNNRKINNNLNSFCLDIGLDNNNEINTKVEGAPNEIVNSNVSCFTVDFGKQNQQMFNNVQLDTNEFYDTEESLKSWVSLVKNTQQQVSTSNLFPILEKRSYSCTVTSLGNSTIQPLSYFYLRNVPLFYGTYWITNVSHDITPNNMITTFKGVRQPILSKSDQRKQLITLLRTIGEKLSSGNVEANVIKTEGIPETNGTIFEIKDSPQSFGEVLQKTNKKGSFYKFDGFEIVANFIYSVTGSYDGVANRLLINVLYNQSKAFSGGNSAKHETILKNMKNIAIGLLQSDIDSGDKTYDTDNKLSLSKLFKDNEYSATSEITSLLNKLKTDRNSEEFTKLNNNVDIFDLKIITSTSINQQVSTPTSAFLTRAQARGYTLQSQLKDADKVTTKFTSITLNKDAYTAYLTMEKAAQEAGINLKIISGYRSLKQQQGIIQRKIRDGLSYDAILQFSAPAGYSEHHTGLAIDLNSLNTKDFEPGGMQYQAGQWLKVNASKYGFYLTYGQNSNAGAAYEPWHYMYKGGATTLTRPFNQDEQELINNQIGSRTTEPSTPSSSTNINTEKVKFDMSSKISGNLTISDIKINTATFYLKETDVNSDLNRDLYGFNKSVKLSEIKDFSVNKINQIDNTDSNYMFLGSYENGKVAFFSGNNGNINWDDSIKTNFRLTDAEEEQIANQFISPKNTDIKNVSDLVWTRKDIPKKVDGDNWEAHAANYISLKESLVGEFTDIDGKIKSKAKFDKTAWRAGYGSDTIKVNGVKTTVVEGGIYTESDSLKTLIEYSIPEVYGPTIESHLGKENWDKLTKWQKVSLVSLGYNAGKDYINKREYGKKIKKFISEGNFDSAALVIANEAPQTSLGVFVQGLANRRLEEAKLFLLPENKTIYNS